MRKSLNDNPTIAIAVMAVLGLVVAFMLLHAMSKPSPGAAATDPAAATATSTDPAAATATSTDPAAAATAPDATGVAPVTDPATGAPAVAVAATPTVGAFEAGPGLPKAVVDAYNSGKVVAIVVLKQNGIDDHDVARATAPLRSDPEVAYFESVASRVARYSRVTEGVDLDRVPAIVVLRPKSLTKGSTPEATVSYGFKSLQSAAQTIHDAKYKGADNLPSFPR